ncbi:MAG: MlaC/ttg2D family ABC transporter substrate-binding protein, partial [Gammaproteobacteria bacterium]
MKYSNISKRLMFFLIALPLGLLPMGESIAADLLPPQVVIKKASDRLKTRLQDENFTKDFAKITEFVEEVIYPSVDFDRISMLVLGKIWKQADADQRTRFKAEFKTLLIRTYARAFLEFEEWSIRYLPLRINDQDKKVVVKTEVLQPGVQPIGVNYRMVLSNGNWKAYDIMVEGVSLVTNYRNSFKNEVKRTGSLESVIAKLEERNKKA